MAIEPRDLPQAPVTEDDQGSPALAAPMVQSLLELAKHAVCKKMALLHLDALQRFRGRALARGMAPADTLIVVFNGDDRVGAIFAGLTMPKGWEAPYRAAGATPIARGLVERAGMYGALAACSETAARQLRAIAGVAVLVVDVGHVALFTYEELDGAATAPKEG